MAIVFALGAFFLWGLADVFAALSSRKVGNIATFVVIQLVGLILFALLFPFFAGKFELFYFFIAFILAVVDSLGLIFFYKAFEEGNVSLNGTIAGSFGLVTVIIALVFFGETLSILAEAGILLVFVGLVMATLKFKELLQNNLAKSFSDRGVIFALLTMLCWGVYFGFLRIPVEKIGWYWTMLPLSFMLPFIIVFPSIRKNIKQIVRKPADYSYSVLHSLTAFGGTIAFNLGIGVGNTSLVAPIASASPILFVVLSRFIFKDRLTHQQWAGIVMTLVGIVMLGLS